MTKTKQLPAAPAAPPPPRDWPALVRRGLVVLVTALVVARPLVLGEDPGLLAPGSDAGGLVLTLLGLVAAAGWAGWRLWYGQGAWHGGLVEAGLLAAAGCYFLSAGVAAPYRHPAWLIASEWLVLVLCLSLVRQLAGTARDRRGLLAAVLATGVSLAAYGIYQAAVELPSQRIYSQDRETLRRDREQQTGRPIDPDGPELALLVERLQQNNIFGTFANPNSFAGYLALLLPLAAGYAAVAWWRRDSTWQPVLAVVATGLVAGALFLTNSRGAIFATLLVAALLRLGFGRHFLGRHLASILRDLAVLIAVGVFAIYASSDKPAAGQSLSLRLNYWKAAWGMVRDHPWLGVGPGNFSRYYTGYMVPTASDEQITDPHNFVLDVWANAGAFAVAGLLLALGALAWRLAGAARRPGLVPRDPPPRDDEDPPWDFYLGGMAGLLLAFLLQASAAPTPDHVIVWAPQAAGRSVVWFAAFALFWNIPWSGPSVLLALAAGMTACLLNLCISGGIAFPSVAQPLWVLAALALALAGSAQPGWILRRGLALFLPLPVLAAAALAYFLLLFVPATGGDSHLRQARQRQDQLHEKQLLLRTKGRDAKTMQEVALLLRSVTEHLQEARKADPTNVAPLVALARWRAEANPGGQPDERALQDLEAARALDPLGKEVRLLTLYTHLRLAQASAKDRRQQLDAAATAADAVREVDPSESARLHLVLADTCFTIGDLQTGYREAVLALQEDSDAGERHWPAYQLTGPQRARARFSVLQTWRLAVLPVLARAPQGAPQALPAFSLNPELAPPGPPPSPSR